jgi:hypothetical protein
MAILLGRAVIASRIRSETLGGVQIPLKAIGGFRAIFPAAKIVQGSRGIDRTAYLQDVTRHPQVVGPLTIATI